MATWPSHRTRGPMTARRSHGTERRVVGITAKRLQHRGVFFSRKWRQLAWPTSWSIKSAWGMSPALATVAVPYSPANAASKRMPGVSAVVCGAAPPCAQGVVRLHNSNGCLPYGCLTAFAIGTGVQLSDLRGQEDPQAPANVDCICGPGDSAGVWGITHTDAADAE
jgi:hypothetical protein